MPSKPFELLGKEILPGKRTVLDLEVAKLHTRTTAKVPVIVVHSTKKGPVLLLLAGLHGDEVNGVAIVREIMEQKLNIPKRGTVICIPVFNIFGYLIQTREFPDGRDLNRMFPGTENSSLASQFAYQFTKHIAPHVDYVMDFHTGGGERENAAQVRCIPTDEKAIELAKIFNPPYILHSNFIPKSLRETLHKMEKVVVLFEGGKSKELNTDIVDCGVRGAQNVMIHLGMISGEIKKSENPHIIRKSKWIRAPHSGMLKLNIKNGSFVKKKNTLGYITRSVRRI